MLHPLKMNNAEGKLKKLFKIKIPFAKGIICILTQVLVMQLHHNFIAMHCIHILVGMGTPRSHELEKCLIICMSC